MDAPYQNTTLPELDEPVPNENDMGLCTEDLGCVERIKELHDYLDMVKKIGKPGCSEEVLEVALSSISSLINLLSVASTPKLHASL
ncbi:hypothetical protein SO802_017485 [Lithocarpus litseifolius]|uniref:Uncharacterized protein n=1 Tax=Lithocarpus litseifolius TaxID=425828 RepID=A0AAW2CK05_9ROSI